MITRNIVECICVRYSLAKRELAGRVKMSPQNFNQKLSESVLRIKDFLAVISSVDLEMHVISNGTVDVLYDAEVLKKSKVFSDAFFVALSAFGCEVVFEDKSTGERLKFADANTEENKENKKHFANFKGMHKGVIYDTAKSRIITNDFAGEDIYGDDGIARELYVDKKGGYFFAEYRNGNTRNKVRAASESEVHDFIEANGVKYQ